jgi:hypothetical protein
VHATIGIVHATIGTVHATIAANECRLKLAIAPILSQNNIPGRQDRGF